MQLKSKPFADFILFSLFPFKVRGSGYRPPYVFTRNPSELQGRMVKTSLVKSARGFGFTIIGCDDGDVEEFLQIKDVTHGGPAWQDGKLKTGKIMCFLHFIKILDSFFMLIHF